MGAITFKFNNGGELFSSVLLFQFHLQCFRGGLQISSGGMGRFWEGRPSLLKRGYILGRRGRLWEGRI